MGQVYKRGKTWYIDLYVKGRRVRKKIGSSKKYAELALKDAEVMATRDEYGFSKKDILIDKLLNQYIEFSELRHQPGTTRRYQAVIDHFQEFLKSNPKVTFVSQITTELIDKYLLFRKNTLTNPNGSIVKEIKEYTSKSPKSQTINMELRVIKLILNQAIKWEYLKENPTNKNESLKVNDSKSIRFLTKKECQKLLDATPENLHPIYFTFLNTGLRKAELENLEWTDVDFRRKKIIIQCKEGWKPKTGEREIPINQSLLVILSDLRKLNSKSIQSNYVFPDKNGGIIKTKLREKLIIIAKKAGIKDLTKVHTLRHTFASHLVMNGVDLTTIKNLLGHSEIQTTMIYAHLAPDHLADAVDTLSFS